MNEIAYPHQRRYKSNSNFTTILLISFQMYSINAKRHSLLATWHNFKINNNYADIRRTDFIERSSVLFIIIVAKYKQNNQKQWTMQLNHETPNYINPLLPSVSIWHRLAKLSILILEGIIEKISYERHCHWDDSIGTVTGMTPLGLSLG